jgi:hypothetical protein
MDFDKIKGDIFGQVADLAESILGNRQDEIVNETKAFLEESEAKLKLWTEAYVTLKIPKNEYELLVKTRVDLLKMKALTQAGMTMIQLDNFRQGVIDIVVKVAAKAIM